MKINPNKDLEIDRIVGIDVIEEMAKPPSLTLGEGQFIDYVIGFYKNPTDENRLRLYSITNKNPRCQFKVHNDATGEYMFTMPAVMGQMNLTSMINPATNNPYIFDYMTISNQADKRGLPGELDSVVEAGKNFNKFDAPQDDLVTIILILKRYNALPESIKAYFNKKEVGSTAIPAPKVVEDGFDNNWD